MEGEGGGCGSYVMRSTGLARQLAFYICDMAVAREVFSLLSILPPPRLPMPAILDLLSLRCAPSPIVWKEDTLPYSPCKSLQGKQTWERQGSLLDL